MAHPPSPLKSALALLERAYAKSRYFIVAASGGKDSNALFALLEELRARHPDVVVGAYHMYTVTGIEAVERPIKIMCKRTDAPLFYVPHFTLPDLLFLSEQRPRSADTARIVTDDLFVKATEAEDAARIRFAAHLSGMPREELMATDDEGVLKVKIKDFKVSPWGIWGLYGQRQNDSLERRAMLSSFRLQKNASGIATGATPGYNVKEMRVYPIYNWTTADVLAYNRARNVPPAAPLGNVNTTNLDPSQPMVVEALKNYNRADYQRLLEWFPNARDESSANPS